MISTIISVVTGLLLAISEIMPFIKTVESQGIIHFLSSISSKFLKNSPDISEIQSLLQISIPENEQNNVSNVSTEKLYHEINIIGNIIKDISGDFNNARQLKLQTSELYQLNYIINYIKQNYIKRQLPFKNLSKSNKELLISEGYIISYDFKEDITLIGW